MRLKYFWYCVVTQSCIVLLFSISELNLAFPLRCVKRHFIRKAAAAWNLQTYLPERPMRHRSQPNERHTFGFHSTSLRIIKIKASFLQFQNPLPCSPHGSCTNSKKFVLLLVLFKDALNRHIDIKSNERSFHEHGFGKIVEGHNREVVFRTYYRKPQTASFGVIPTAILAGVLTSESQPSTAPNTHLINPYPTAFPYGNGMVLHFYQQQESSTTKTVHKVINKGLKDYV